MVREVTSKDSGYHSSGYDRCIVYQASERECTTYGDWWVEEEGRKEGDKEETYRS